MYVETVWTKWLKMMEKEAWYNFKGHLEIPDSSKDLQHLKAYFDVIKRAINARWYHTNKRM